MNKKTTTTHRGRGRPRKHPINPDAPPVIRIIPTKRRRLPKSAPGEKETPPSSSSERMIPQWHNKRARSVSDNAGSPVGRTTPSSSTGCSRPPMDEILVFECLADFEIPGPIPDLADLMSDMTIFQDFFNDIEDHNWG